MYKSTELSIAIPASIVSDIPHLREKTARIGIIGRAAAIFRVNEVIIYPDMPKVNQNRDIKLASTILSYMETPQYLRKWLFKVVPELRYAGVLPPLRTAHHPLTKKLRDLEVGEYREGVSVSRVKDGVLVDVGVEQPVLVLDKDIKLNKRITVKIIKTQPPPEAMLVNRQEIKTYWGFQITATDMPLGKLIKEGKFDLVLATSRLGTPLAKVKEEILKRWKNAYKVLVAFGAPTHGLYEIVKHENLALEGVVDFVVNTIPFQGTETVRTEEAICASLAILNIITSW
ncbi:MAG: putative RNA uridine N3 methyltransferase [Candidatus Bathyarchaeales archaeon]